MNELQLQTGAYRTTYIGTEVLRPSTIQEWSCYGEILRRVDEAKQWAIGDWLVDGKRHYGDGLYKEASEILGIGYNELARFKRMSELHEFRQRCLNLSFGHHYEVSSLKLIEEDQNGKLKLSKEPDKDKMQWFLAKAEKDNWSVRFLREQIQKHKVNQQKEIELANEPEKYKIIYADPPWKYNDELIEGYGSATHHYPPMSIQELSNLKIKNITTENSVLFLWVTSPFLNECWPVIKSWGFEYKSSFVWDKVKHNYGHYNSVRHEILLICTKGSCLPQIPELLDSVISIERSEIHSEKPEEFRNIIDKMYPEGKRIELFARGELPRHWKAWGNEII